MKQFILKDLYKANPFEYNILFLYPDYFVCGDSDVELGFALINFPTNCEEAAFLEEMLTGIRVPEIALDLKYIKSIVDLIELDKRVVEETSDNSELRKSRLVPNPVTEEEPPEYKTYLTAYIRVHQLPIEEEAGDPDLPPIVDQYTENLDTLSKFYVDQGCYYNMFYKSFDFATIKYLAKLVIGDFRLPIKASLELFGEDLERAEADFDAYKVHKKATSSKQVSGTKKKSKLKVKVIKGESKQKHDKLKKKKGSSKSVVSKGKKKKNSESSVGKSSKGKKKNKSDSSVGKSSKGKKKKKSDKSSKSKKSSKKGKKGRSVFKNR